MVLFTSCVCLTVLSLLVFVPPLITFPLPLFTITEYRQSQLPKLFPPLAPCLCLSLSFPPAFTGGSQGAVCGCPQQTVVRHKPIVSPYWIIPAFTADRLSLCAPHGSLSLYIFPLFLSVCHKVSLDVHTFHFSFAPCLSSFFLSFPVFPVIFNPHDDPLQSSHLWLVLSSAFHSISFFTHTLALSLCLHTTSCYFQVIVSHCYKRTVNAPLSAPLWWSTMPDPTRARPDVWLQVRLWAQLSGKAGNKVCMYKSVLGILKRPEPLDHGL